MSTANPLRHLRASTAHKRPAPASMADGQLALNTNDGSPGLFFKNSNGALVKVGPVHVGTTAPNASPASGGTAGNSIGEQWLDTTGGTYVFKIWDGTAWRSEVGDFVSRTGSVMTGALGIIAGTAAAPGIYISGDTDTGIHSPSADTLAVTTAGVQKFAIDSFDGNPIIETSYPTIRPTLDLNFAQTKRLDPRVTFSRSSSATFFDGNGVLRSAATNVARFDHNPATGESLGLLVEEARTNQIRSSNNFTFADWHFSQCKMTPNAALAPDGTQTAALIQQTDGTSTRQFICTSYSVSATGSPWTASVYVKQFNYDYVIFGAGDEDSGSRGSRFGYLQAQLRFQFSTKTLTVSPSTSWGGAVTGSGYEELPNGWFRLWVSKASFPRANYWGISVQQNLTGNSGTSNDLDLVTGNGSSGVYFWGMQWESGGFRTSHIPTPATFTGRSSTATFYDANGVIQTAGSGAARSNAFFPDSNGVMRPAGLLLEAAATNLLTRSEEFDNAAWFKTGGTVTPNTASAPDSTLTADTLAYSGVNRIAVERNTLASTISGTTYTTSIFVKVAGGDARYVQLWNHNGATAAFANFDIIAGTLGSSSSNAAPFIQKLSNNWYRVGFVAVSNSSIWYPCVSVVDSASASRDGNYSGSTASIYIWGAQLEASPYPTSYIPTVASTVTRAADTSTSATVTRSADVANITGTNFSSWYRQDEGTWFGSISRISGSGRLIEATGPSAAYSMSIRPSTSSVGFARLDSGSAGVAYTSLPVKTAASYSSPSIRGAVNGTLANLVTNGIHSNSINNLDIGRIASESTYIGGTISRLTYYPVRLPDATLQTITQ